MTVYIVENGERYEGGSVVSVHSSYAKAVEAALAVQTHFAGGWKPDREDHWTNGCDYVTVLQYEVKE